MIVAAGLLIGFLSPENGKRFFDLFHPFDSQHENSHRRNSSQDATQAQSGLIGPFEVKRVVDGDTLVIIKESKEVKIRLLGINAPESVHEDEKKNTKEGKEASEWLKEYLGSQKVYLEYDQEAQDKFGRDLAYVYLEDQNSMVNKKIISEGLARVVEIEPNTKYFEELKATEKSAKQNKQGFWGTGFYK